MITRPLADATYSPSLIQPGVSLAAPGRYISNGPGFETPGQGPEANIDKYGYLIATYDYVTAPGTYITGQVSFDNIIVVGTREKVETTLAGLKSNYSFYF